METDMTKAQIRNLDRIMTDLAEKGYAYYVVPDGPVEDVWIDKEYIRAAAKDEGVQVRFGFRDRDGAFKVSLRKVGRGH